MDPFPSGGVDQFPAGAISVACDTIGQILREDLGSRAILVLILVKGTIWAVSLGSGTSGGVLARLLMMGGALGGLEALIFPHAGLGFWPRWSSLTT